MIEETKQVTDDALEMIVRRNEFYKKKYHAVFGIYLLSLLTILFLLSILIYLIEHPTRPLYFIADPVSRLLRNIPNSEPNMTPDDVINWTIEAVEAAYSYDFVNYRAQLQNAQKYFSEYGWRNYMKGLTASNNLIGLTTRKLVFIAKVVNKPKIVNQGMLGNAYGWKLEMPLLVKYLQPPAYDDQTSFPNAYVVSVIVQRQNLLQSYKGLAIIQMIATQPRSTTAQTTPALLTGSPTQVQ